MASKIGRPTDNPKSHRITVRIDETTKNILEQYCEQEKISINEGVRKGISLLGTYIKK